MTTVQPHKAKVKNGRLVLDEPTDLPEGAEVALAVLDARDSELDETDQAALDQALDEALDDSDAGEVMGETEVWTALRAQR